MDKFIYRAVRTNKITQGFGIENTNPSLLSKYKSFGLISHNGIDFLAQDREPIYFPSTGRGKVIETSIDKSGGLGVVVLEQRGDKFYKHYFWHLRAFGCQIGQMVESGDFIGWADNTGWSTGPHLHYGLKESDKDGETQNYTNGYLGAINPEPYLYNIYIKDFLATQKKEIKILLTENINLIQKIVNWISDFLKGRVK